MSSKLNNKMRDAVDQVEAMKFLEERYQCCDYSCRTEYSNVNDGITVNRDCRSKMVQWCYQVIEFYDIDREIVVVAFSYADKYIGKVYARSTILKERKRYQLLVMTSLYVATKVFETKVIELNLLVKLGRGTYIKRDFEEMERDLLSTLEWRLHPPTPTSFIRQILLIASSMNMNEKFTSALFNLACFQIERGLHEYKLALCKPSTVATCAILNAFDLINTYSASKSSLSDHGIFSICKIEVITNDVVKVRRLLNQEVYLPNTLPMNNPSASKNPTIKASVGNIRHSPICVGRQTQRFVG